MILDGIGYNYLKNRGSKTIFSEYLRGSMTSVFPPTTASSITSFRTGLAPQQHAITGWFMNLKELGCVFKILPFKARQSGASFEKANIDFTKILGAKTVFDEIKVDSFMINPNL